MEDKLVTLAIRTYQRAQMIKTVLQEEGIETVIHNLNLENPEMAVGVRVRIKESDLPRALKIVEEMESAWEEEKPVKESRTVLIPVDFADQVPKTIDFGFNMADNIGAEIVFLYVYFTPAFTISMNNDVSTYSISDSELLRRIISSANADVENMDNLIKKRIKQGELPNLKYRFELKEGVPEDQILDFCKKHKPDLVVMGSRGKKISNELLGSVTAEVMESCETPVFAIPIMIKQEKFTDLKKVAFITNFDQKDLIAVDKVISTFNNPQLELCFIHASDKKHVWDEIMLSGIKAYFTNHYPEVKTNYAVVESTDSPEKINEFVEQMQVDVLAFNTRRKKLFARIFNPGLAYKMIYHSDIPLFVTHV
ncbi:MAG: universal stress protein [Paludibacter sp.]|nr:universal stress protein [Paludibacter sp.]MDD4198127.1 universal stress protein [Paludibacter sp.]MDD4427377.1 universal stress protein [Paludibacter sp.]